MMDVIDNLEFNAAWAIITWMQVFVVPYGIWFNPSFKSLALGFALSWTVIAFGGLLSLSQGGSFVDVLTLKEITLVGRSIVVGYGLLVATILIVIGKSVGVFIFVREDKPPPYID